jgi:hypothetical protein
LLLDEIGELSLAMQVKLLRALQEREVRRVGENRSRRIDVRVIAATHRHLAQDVEAGTFRQDLYYRLKVVELHVPPLRERREDLLPLARVLLKDAATRMKRKISGFAPETADRLLAYPWPGNVRELENTMERAVALARGLRVELEDLPEEIRNRPTMPTLAPGVVHSLADIEKSYILEVLHLNGGNQTLTARQLQIGSATLYRKLKSYASEHPPESSSEHPPESSSEHPPESSSEGAPAGVLLGAPVGVAPEAPAVVPKAPAVVPGAPAVVPRPSRSTCPSRPRGTRRRSRDPGPRSPLTRCKEAPAPARSRPLEPPVTQATGLLEPRGSSIRQA